MWEGLAVPTLHPWIVSLSQKTILAVSFLCCANFYDERKIASGMEQIRGHGDCCSYLWLAALEMMNLLRDIHQSFGEMHWVVLCAKN